MHSLLAAKHVPGKFWQGFTQAAGVFSIGEVYGSDIGCVLLSLVELSPL